MRKSRTRGISTLRSVRGSAVRSASRRVNKSDRSLRDASSLDLDPVQGLTRCLRLATGKLRRVERAGKARSPSGAGARKRRRARVVIRCPHRAARPSCSALRDRRSRPVVARVDPLQQQQADHAASVSANDELDQGEPGDGETLRRSHHSGWVDMAAPCARRIVASESVGRDYVPCCQRRSPRSGKRRKRLGDPVDRTGRFV